MIPDLIPIYTSIANPKFSLVFGGEGHEVLRITPEGDLIFANASAAAEALMQEWNRLRGSAWAVDRDGRYRRALEAIQQKVVDGQVCDDVAWFDQFTTLHDFIDEVLHPSQPAAIADLFPNDGECN